MISKIIKGFPNYSITNTGRVRNNKFNRWLKSVKQPHGYLTVDLGHRNKQYIHKLVLEAFIGKCPKGMECCHNNGNKSDNTLENLRWDTKSNNQKDSVRLGTHHSFGRGELHITHKLTEKDVINIIHLYNTKMFRQQEIAGMYNIRQNTVSRIVNRKIWKHI